MSKLADLLSLTVGGAVVIGAVVSGSLISANMVKNGGAPIAESSVEEQVPEEPLYHFDPITDDIKDIADQFEYEFDAANFVQKEEEDGYKFAEDEEGDGYFDENVSKVPTTGTRPAAEDGTEYHLVYRFEGAYAEGYQGDYSETYGDIYLWDDGLFGGKINDTQIRGYWYNSSTEADDDEQDCLNLVSNVNRYESIVCARANGFYEWRAHIYLGFSWGTRSMEVCAYRYYPEVALAIDPTSTNGTDFMVGQSFDIKTSGWVADRILKNLNYSSVFKKDEVKWTVEEGMLENGKFAAAGEFTVSAKWNNLEASITVNVAPNPDIPEEAPAGSSEAA